MKNSLPATVRKSIPAACLFGLSLILTGCNADRSQDEQLLPYVHNTSYGQSAVALPPDLRHYQRTPRTVRTHHHAAPPAEVLTAGN